MWLCVRLCVSACTGELVDQQAAAPHLRGLGDSPLQQDLSGLSGNSELNTPPWHSSRTEALTPHLLPTAQGGSLAIGCGSQAPVPHHGALLDAARHSPCPHRPAASGAHVCVRPPPPTAASPQKAVRASVLLPWVPRVQPHKARAQQMFADDLKGPHVHPALPTQCT